MSRLTPRNFYERITDKLTVKEPKVPPSSEQRLSSEISDFVVDLNCFVEETQDSLVELEASIDRITTMLVSQYPEPALVPLYMSRTLHQALFILKIAKATTKLKFETQIKSLEKIRNLGKTLKSKGPAGT